MPIDTKKMLFIAAGVAMTAVGVYYRKKLSQLTGDRVTFVQKPSDIAKEVKDVSNMTEDDVPHMESTKAEELEKTLREYLSGDVWIDEDSWLQLWNEANVLDSKQWIREKSHTLIQKETKLLKEKPAFISGYRRRFVVLCRYAGVTTENAHLIWKNSFTQKS